MVQFILEYVMDNREDWESQPAIFTGEGFQDAVILAFGRPKLAIFAHIDSVGYCTAYGNRLIKIGGPKAKDGAKLVGRDKDGDIEAILRIKEEVDEKDKDGKKKEIFEYESDREIELGIPLTYKQEWIENDESVQSCYLDNRLGVWNVLQLCPNLSDTAIVFTTYEEHGGGTAQFAGRFLFKSFGCRTALISDVTLISDGIKHGDGVAISMRDRGIPRQAFVRQIRRIADQQSIQYQLEVEDAGGSDGTQLQLSPYPWDWCFIGPPEANYHTPEEKVYKYDIEQTLDLYKALCRDLM